MSFDAQMTQDSSVTRPAATQLSDKSEYRLTVMGILSLAAVTSIALGAHYTYTRSNPVLPVQHTDWTSLPDRPLVVEEEQVLPPPKPTLYRNPFDRSEVFELPPGLTQEEAKDMVAELLMERARKRAAR